MGMYEENKQAKVGENLSCPICSNEFKKKIYSQAFCCGKCKDRYWNKLGDRHREGYYKLYRKRKLKKV